MKPPALVELPCASGESCLFCDGNAAVADVTHRFGDDVGSTESGPVQMCDHGAPTPGANQHHDVCGGGFGPGPGWNPDGGEPPPRDALARDELVGIIGDFLLDSGHSVLFSTHITTDLDRVGDYLTLVHGGRVVRTGTKDDILDAYRVVRAGPDDLNDLVGVKLIGVRRTPTVTEALVRTDEADLLDADVLVEPPSLEQIAVHIGAPAGRRKEIA